MSQPSSKSDVLPQAGGINWLLVFYYLAFHLGCLGILCTGVTYFAVTIAVATWLLRYFGVAIGYHRYFAHRSFKTSRPMQFVLALCGTLAMQRGVLWWAQMHRSHHRHVDSELDIHSPRHRGVLIAHSFWFADRRYGQTDLSAVPDLAKFPELVLLDGAFGRLVLLAYMGIMYSWFGWTGIVWGVCVSGVMTWHATHVVQSISHLHIGGYRSCPTPDETRNHWWIGIPTLGEWHNNHHYCPSAARQGRTWREIDIQYGIIRVFSMLRLVWDVRLPPTGELVATTSAGAPSIVRR
jgi:stearoyl-CoA desaturase (delta-9 desaturase)